MSENVAPRAQIAEEEEDDEDDVTFNYNLTTY